MFGYVWSLDICLFNCCCLDVVFHLSSVHRFSLWGFELCAMVPCQLFGSSVLSSFSSMPKAQLPRCFSRHWVTMVTWIVDPYGSLWIPMDPSGLVEDAAIDLGSSMAFGVGHRTLRVSHPGWLEKRRPQDGGPGFVGTPGMPQNSWFKSSLSPFKWPRIWGKQFWDTQMSHCSASTYIILYPAASQWKSHESIIESPLNQRCGDRCLKKRTATTSLVRPCGMC